MDGADGQLRSVDRSMPLVPDNQSASLRAYPAAKVLVYMSGGSSHPWNRKQQVHRCYQGRGWLDASCHPEFIHA